MKASKIAKKEYRKETRAQNRKIYGELFEKLIKLRKLTKEHIKNLFSDKFDLSLLKGGKITDLENSKYGVNVRYDDLFIRKKFNLITDVQSTNTLDLALYCERCDAKIKWIYFGSLFELGRILNGNCYCNACNKIIKSEEK